MRPKDLESEEVFLTVKEYAWLMRFTYRAALNQVKRGDVKAIKLGNHYRIPASQFTEFFSGGDNGDKI